MLEYIYFVKCPNCEDEHFYFFNEAKDFAMSCISKKPIITQIEVDRNDFGECVDSCDLGTVWSWEEAMDRMTDDEPAISVFTKDDLKQCDCDGKCGSNCKCGNHIEDPEFAGLDNSITVEIEEVSGNAREPVPEGMTLDELVEAMEENETDVECKSCNELFDKSECRYDKDYGWLCDRCQRAINDHGGELAFTKAPLVEASKYKDSIELHYDSLTAEVVTRVIPATRWEPEEYVDAEYTDEFDFEVETDRIIEVLWDDLITEEDVQDVPGGLDALEDDTVFEAFFDTHLEVLIEKYYDRLLEIFVDEAEEAARDEFQERYDDSHGADAYADRAYDEYRDRQLFGEGKEKQKPFLEEFDDAETHKASLIDCPECGTVSYDAKEHYCINCGLNL
jgi:hypothetical protein